MASSKLKMADRLVGKDSSVWVEIDKLITENKALNLGQGFPDFAPPDYIKEILSKTVCDENPFIHQYTRSFGHPRLVKALAQTYGPLLKRDIDPMSEIITSIGADGSLFYAILGLVNPGEEAIIIEPYFDTYAPMVNLAGGVPVFVPLRPTISAGPLCSADWKFDEKEFASNFNSNTKMLILNTPNNPLGKVYTQDELQFIADLCIKHDVICIADEVYEWMIYPGQKHVKIATLSGMWDRTVTIGSAGKTFSVTGWKLGWAIGPKNLILALQTMHMNSMYICPTPLQEAVGRALELESSRFGQPDCYFKSIVDDLLPKKDKMAEILREGGMNPILPDGGYFMVADLSKLDVDLDPHSNEDKCVQLVKWLIKHKKIAGIPVSTFYSHEHKHLAEHFIRFCFFKDEKTLDKAEKIMKKFSPQAHNK